MMKSAMYGNNKQPKVELVTPPAADDKSKKPRLVMFRGKHVNWSPNNRRPAPVSNLPHFIHSHLAQQIKCLSVFFDVSVILGDCNYAKICDQYQPDLALFESGIYGGPREITHISAVPSVPKLGFLHADAYCPTRNVFLSDMERWGIETFFTICVSMSQYIPDALDNLFVWPNFIDPLIYHDYGENKIIPVLITGSRAIHYPWRNAVSEAIAGHFPALTCPHGGWLYGTQQTSRMMYDEPYARMINASLVAPTCGTIAREVVRKHFEIPGSNSCLITEDTQGVRAAGFIDMVNCVFASEVDVIDKLDYIFKNRDVLHRITRAGYELVHSQHTLFQRSQILQWFMLHKNRGPFDRIVQPNPFGPLSIVGNRSKLRNFLAFDSIDRAILRSGYERFRSGDYENAERYFLRCLNYHFMPEPILGLTLCSLYRGDAGRALEWIVQPIRIALEDHRALDPDPVEWTYYIVSLLCHGNLADATKRAGQFPLLDHHELRHCRVVVDALNGLTHSFSECGSESAGAKVRASIHQLPQRDRAGWVSELCTMLRACQQYKFAEDVHRSGSRAPAQAAVSHHISVMGRSRESNTILPLTTSKPFRQKIRHHMPRWLRALRRRLLRALSFSDRFTVAVEIRARTQRIESALIVGATCQSVYTRAFLEGTKKNPSMPTVFCLVSPRNEFDELERCFGRDLCLRLIEQPVNTIESQTGLTRFDVIMMETLEFDIDELIKIARKAKTLLIQNIDSYNGQTIVRTLTSENHHSLVDGEISHPVGRNYSKMPWRVIGSRGIVLERVS
jgi:hypothetical protein